jgi:hypothetical protein
MGGLYLIPSVMRVQYGNFVAVPDTSTCVRLGRALSSISAGVRKMPRMALPASASTLFWQCSYCTLGSFWVAFAAETILEGEAGRAESCAQSCTPGQDTYNRGVVQANQAALVANCIGFLYNILLPLIARRVGVRLTYTCSTTFVALAFSISRSRSETASRRQSAATGVWGSIGSTEIFAEGTAYTTTK